MIKRIRLHSKKIKRTVQAKKTGGNMINTSEKVNENMITKKVETQEHPSITFSKKVLDEFRKNVGKYYPETGGLLASTRDSQLIDCCYFDIHSKNTPGTFYYDVETMSEVYRKWKAKGYVTNGIYHSHPAGATRPSYHDISTALLHLDFFNLDYFYLPIFQPRRNGQYRMYLYVVRRKVKELKVNLEYVIKAVASGYTYEQSKEWSMNYSIKELREYRSTIDHPQSEKPMSAEIHKSTNATTPKNDYFVKVKSLYSEKVLDKVIVCVGTGGARSFLENMARCGFKNYVLLDADVVSPSNIATQGVYISEIGKKKVDVIRDRILDINPSANVLCVDRFLDDQMSDEEFKGYLDSSSGKEPKDYLILGCTDNFDAQKRSSLLALKYGMPYLAAMLYEGGAAAELIFVYPGVTESCPRCLLRDRFEKYENGFVNDVDSSACPIFATERMNAIKGYVALMLLMYQEEPSSMFNSMLDEVKDRNFVEIRMNPHLKECKLGIGLFDRVLESASKYTFMDETLWIPQHPDRPEFGEKPCLLCGGTGDLRSLQTKWKDTDTRTIRFDLNSEEKSTYENVTYEPISLVQEKEEKNTVTDNLPKASGFYGAEEVNGKSDKK